MKHNYLVEYPEYTRDLIKDIESAYKVNSCTVKN